MSHSPILLRFAPSPNGYLHLGHAFSALEAQRWADALGGKLLLRMEDTDLSRARAEFVDAIVEDLHWLGIKTSGPVRHQSEHLGDYSAALQKLWDLGLVYPTLSTRSEIRRFVDNEQGRGGKWPVDPDGAPIYPFGQRDRAAKPKTLPDATPLRLDMAATLKHLGKVSFAAPTLMEPGGPTAEKRLDPSIWGDVLLRGRDRPATYHLAVVVDDAIQRISHVVRGLDIAPSTGIHILLQELLGLPTPVYHHHRLILGGDGRKLSKSDGAMSLRELRRDGRTPSDIKKLVGLQLG